MSPPSSCSSLRQASKNVPREGGWGHELHRTDARTTGAKGWNERQRGEIWQPGFPPVVTRLSYVGPGVWWVGGYGCLCVPLSRYSTVQYSTAVRYTGTCSLASNAEKARCEAANARERTELC